MGFWIFFVSVLASAIIVYSIGKAEERRVMSILIAAYIATAILYRIGSQSWLELNIGILITDGMALCALLIIAYRSKRYWPMPVAALHALTIMAMLIIGFGENLQNHGVELLQAVWCYPQLAILVWAALRSRKREALKATA